MSRGGFGNRDGWADVAAKQGLSNVRSKKKPRKKPGEEEHQIQCAFIEWVRIMQNSKWPELELLYAIPNGGFRHISVAAKLKAEGAKAGVLDMHLPVPRGPWHSLFLETKKPGGNMSPEQKEFAWLAMKQGNLVKVCDSVDKLIRVTEDYLVLPAPTVMGEAA